MLIGVSISKMFPVDPHSKFLHTRWKTEVSFGSTDPAVLLEPLAHTAMPPVQAQGNLHRSLPCPGSHVWRMQCQGKGVLPGPHGGGTGQRVPPPESAPAARWDCRLAGRQTRSHPPHLQKQTWFTQPLPLPTLLGPFYCPLTNLALAPGRFDIHWICRRSSMATKYWKVPDYKGSIWMTWMEGESRHTSLR